MKLRHLVMAALFGCASTPARYVPSADVVVDNQHWLDHAVYASCGGNARVGTVGGLRTTTFRLPPACMGRMVSFVVDPIGSDSRSVSDAIAVDVGDRLALSIPAYTNGYVFLSK